MSSFEAVVTAVREEGTSLRNQLAAQVPEQESPAVRDAKDAANASKQDKQIDLLEKIAGEVTNTGKNIDISASDEDSGFGGFIKKFFTLKKLLIGGAIALAIPVIMGFLDSDLWKKLKTTITEDLLPALKDIYKTFMEDIVPALERAFKFLKEDIYPILEKTFLKQIKLLQGAIKDISAAFTKMADGDFLCGMYDLIVGLGSYVLKSIDNINTGLFNIIARIFGLKETDSVYGSISKFFKDTYNSVVNSVATAFLATHKFILKTYTDITDKVTGFFVDTYNKVVEEIKFTLLMVKISITNTYNDIKKTVTGFFSDLFEKTVEKFKVGVGMVEAIKDKVSCIITGVKDYVFEFVDNVIKGIGEFFQKIVDFDVVATIRKMAASGGELAQKAINFLFGEEGPEPVNTQSLVGRSRTDVGQMDDTGGPEESKPKPPQNLSTAVKIGAYDKSLVPFIDSDINKKILEKGVESGQIQKEMLQAIINDKDLSDKDLKFMEILVKKATTKGSLFVHDIRAIEKMDEVVKKINESPLNGTGGAVAPVVVNNVTSAPVDASSSSVTHAAVMPMSPPTNYNAIL